MNPFTNSMSGIFLPPFGSSSSSDSLSLSSSYFLAYLGSSTSSSSSYWLSFFCCAKYINSNYVFSRSSIFYVVSI